MKMIDGMVDERLALTLIIIIAIGLLFFAICSIILKVRNNRGYLVSENNQEQRNNNNTYNEPKPKGVSLTKVVNFNNKPYEESPTNNNNHPAPSNLTTLGHEGIIKENKTDVNQKRTLPNMQEPGYIDRVVCALKKVPEKSLLIIELANRFALDNGLIDQQAVEASQAEVNLAIAEAKNYATHTTNAVDSLQRLEALPDV